MDKTDGLQPWKDVDFDKCFARAKISDYNGVKIPVLHAEDLLYEKKQIAREKDTVDISFLEALVSKFKAKKKSGGDALPTNKDEDVEL